MAKPRNAVVWIITIVVVIALFALGWFFILMPVRAQREWDAVRTALEAKEEKLSLADFPPPKISDADNFFADPIWWELSDRVPVKTEDGIVHRPRLATDKWQVWVLQKQFLESEKADFPEFRN